MSFVLFLPYTGYRRLSGGSYQEVRALVRGGPCKRSVGTEPKTTSNTGCRSGTTLLTTSLLTLTSVFCLGVHLDFKDFTRVSVSP